MDASGSADTLTEGSIEHANAMLDAAAEARKRWACGCLRHASDSINEALPATKRDDALVTALAPVSGHLLPQRYECLGCDVCYPAVALNDLVTAGVLDATGSAACPTDSVEERHEWPPLSGAYRVLRYQAPVAICTLNDEGLAATVASTRLPELAIVGTMHTENLGIERLVANVTANPHIRFVVVCGSNNRQAIGHLPGQALVALAQNGIDERQRIIRAKGKRPVLRNLGAAAVEHFRCH